MREKQECSRHDVNTNYFFFQGVGLSLLEVMDEACQSVVERLLPSLPATEKVKYLPLLKGGCGEQ